METLHIYSFDVAHSSHELLRRGITEAGYSRVVVAATSEADAHLLAAQMVAHRGMPTRVLYRF